MIDYMSAIANMFSQRISPLQLVWAEIHFFGVNVIDFHDANDGYHGSFERPERSVVVLQQTDSFHSAFYRKRDSVEHMKYQ